MSGYLVPYAHGLVWRRGGGEASLLRNHAPAFAGEELVVCGTVASVVSNDGTGEAVIAVSIVKNGAAEVVSGEAVVRLA